MHIIMNIIQSLTLNKEMWELIYFPLKKVLRIDITHFQKDLEDEFKSIVIKSLNHDKRPFALPQVSQDLQCLQQQCM